MSKKIDELIEQVKQGSQKAIAEADEKLDKKKDEWAALASVDPDAARRQLRMFWICVAGGLGIVIGAVLHSAYIWLF